MGMFDFLTPGVATTISGLTGFLGQQETNSANQANAQAQMDFQERLSNSAYQRQVADMSAAGLNPMLAYMKGGGASTPTGAMATYQNPATSGVNAALSTSQTYKTQAEIPNVEAQTKVLQSQYDLNNAQYDLVLQNTEKVFKESRNLDTEQDRLKSLIVNLAESSALMAQQGETQVSIRKVNLATIANLQAHSKLYGAMTTSTNYDAQLKLFDVQAAQGVGNFGREYNQVKPVIDLLKSLKR